MLVIKIIVAILAIVAASFNSLDDYQTYEGRSFFIGLPDIICIVLIIIYSTILIITKWNVFTIPKIIVLIAICLWVKFGVGGNLFVVIIIVIVIAYIIAWVVYFTNIKKCETPDIKTIKTSLVCAKDNSSIRGNILYIVENSVYKYYTETEDGGYKLYSIPADLTTIYYIGNEEEPYLETIITTKYSINTNNIPATRCFEYNTESYKIYVPEGSIESVFEFDAE